MNSQMIDMYSNLNSNFTCSYKIQQGNSSKIFELVFVVQELQMKFLKPAGVIWLINKDSAIQKVPCLVNLPTTYIGKEPDSLLKGTYFCF